MDTNSYGYPWGQEYNGDSGTGMINPPKLPNGGNIEGVDSAEMNNAIQNAIGDLVGSAPETLDTLGEIADALKSGEGAIESITSEIAKKVDSKTYDADKETFALKSDINPSPTKTSELENDSNFITSEEVGQAVSSAMNGLASVAKSGSYDDLSNKPEIPTVPTSVSSFTNDVGYITEHQDISGLATKKEVETISESIPTKVSDLSNDSKYQTESDVNEKIKNIIGTAPETLDTLGEIAEKLSGNDDAVASLVNTLSNKIDSSAVESTYATKDEVSEADKGVVKKIDEKLWSNTKDDGTGYFQTKYLHDDGSYAQIWNESDGGGSQYFNSGKDLLTYVGTNDGENGITAQIYSKIKSTNLGARLNVSNEGMYYAVGASTPMDTEHELAVKGDIPSLDGYATNDALAGVSSRVSSLEDSNASINQNLSELSGTVEQDYATKEYVGNADNDVIKHIDSKLWSNTKNDGTGYFQTKFSHEDGSYALMWNESDGGGSQYYHASDNTISYVGTADQGSDGICVQIYSKNKVTNLGSRLNVNPNGIYYATGSSTPLTDDNEIATKKDIPSLDSYATSKYVDEADNAILGKIWNSERNYFETNYSHDDGSYAKIWNESDGGGSQYYNASKGLLTYVGTNDGENGITAQIYSKIKSTNIGARLNVSNEGMYYGVGASTPMDEQHELAVKGDIPSLAEYAKSEEINAQLSELDVTKAENETLINYINSLTNRLSVLETRVSDSSKTNKVEVNFSDNTEALDDVAADYNVTGNISTTATITGKSVTLDSAEITNNARVKATANEVEIVNTNISGDFPKNDGGNTIVSVNSAEYVTIKDLTISEGASGYNTIEIGLSASGVLPKSIVIENCNFEGSFSNNAISIFGTQNNSVISINNCHFGSFSNILRLSNNANSTGVVVNVTNCTVDKWETGSDYTGFMLCQDYTSGTAEAETENNLFGNGKIKVNITNLVGPNGKIETPSDASTVCGTKDDNQLCYVYCNKSGFITYSADRYPVLNIC